MREKRGNKLQKKIMRLVAFMLSICMLFSKELPVYAQQDLEVEEYLREATAALGQITSDFAILGTVYLCDTYPVREQASVDSPVLVEVPGGQTVEIADVEIVFTEDGFESWCKVKFVYQDAELVGYVARQNIATADERFLEWEVTYNTNPMAGASMYALEGQSATPADIAMFPADYQPALLALKQKYPEWTFVAMNTGLDWNTVIANELLGEKSLIDSSIGDWTKEGAYDDAGWYYASEEILRYYMDPRNFLTEDQIFQFEQLVYNESRHKKEALATFLNTTFMNDSKNAPETDLTFHTIIWAVGKEQNMSPYHIASRIAQEQGQGTSGLISGTYPGYEKLYNYFNIGATGKTAEECIINGLKTAQKNNWVSAYNSIRGGAIMIAANYIKRGQDTLYLQKYNVTTNQTYGHQYMQNIAAPSKEGRRTRNIYANAGVLNAPFVFKIPVYQNMPTTVSAMPTASTNVVLDIPDGYDTTVYLDGVPTTSVARNGYQIVKAGHAQAKTAVVYKYNEKKVPVSMYVWTLSYKNNAYVAKAQPQMENLLSYHGLSIRITGKSGIRFKTGIDKNVRATLLSSGGIDGFRLKEYGTLVMNKANLNTLPMVKGGEKVSIGVSFGKDANGLPKDDIYATVNNRYHYTAVYVGLPATVYKNEFAFRGYAVLEKDGVEYVMYGPIVSRSIYSLAETVLASGTYPDGSPAQAFLQQIIKDAK